MNRLSFTLIELVIIVAIIIILAGMILPIINTTRQEAREAKVLYDLQTIKKASHFLHADTGFWPKSDCLPEGASLSSFCRNGEDLVENTSGYAGWNGPYLTEWRRDPWGQRYYIYQQNSPFSPVLWALCLGPDIKSSDDDISCIITPDRSK